MEPWTTAACVVYNWIYKEKENWSNESTNSKYFPVTVTIPCHDLATTATKYDSPRMFYAMKGKKRYGTSSLYLSHLLPNVSFINLSSTNPLLIIDKMENTAKKVYVMIHAPAGRVRTRHSLFQLPSEK